ncbi:hypothetical protein [Streptomyces chryseus]
MSAIAAFRLSTKAAPLVVAQSLDAPPGRIRDLPAAQPHSHRLLSSGSSPRRQRVQHRLVRLVNRDV